MAKTPKPHPYTELQAFERLMLLIATLIKYPGVGYENHDSDESNKTLSKSLKNSHYNSLEEVKIKMRELADSLNIYLAPNYPSTFTIRKDLQKLREYQILDAQMYRWGYYLGTGVMSREELKIAFDAIRSQAIYQGHPRLRNTYKKLSKRLKGFEVTSNSDFFYPVRQNLNRVINYTDPQEMRDKGNNRHSLFHYIDRIESAIIQGKLIEIIRNVDYYGGKRLGPIVIYPLQLIYYDIAWYLLYQEYRSGCLVIGRVNRYSDHCRVYNTDQRDIKIQTQSLNSAYQLLTNGWGLKLGNLEEQQLELEGKLEFIPVKVRFYPPISNFILEGELRHPNQKLKQGTKDQTTGKAQYIDYSIKLPPRSLDEFMIWVQRYLDKAEVLSPPELAQKHHQAAIALVSRYQ